MLYLFWCCVLFVSLFALGILLSMLGVLVVSSIFYIAVWAVKIGLILCGGYLLGSVICGVANKIEEEGKK